MSIKEEKIYSINQKRNNIEEISEEQKQNLVDKTINKWLNLQKTIKEEITLEDVIIKQQQDDMENLKSFFLKYYQAKLNIREKLNQLNNLKVNDEGSVISSYQLKENLSTSFHDATEPIKNLLFILRNNYDYLTRAISLIKPEDFTTKFDNINSLVELLNNNFYENILIPNPEQHELLILIYKLLEQEILHMGGVCSQNFLDDDTFLGMFISSFAKKQEIIGYFSMILNSLIISIDDDDSKDCFDFNIKNIIKAKESQKEKRKSLTKSPEMNSMKMNLDMNIKGYLFDKIPKTKIKFKNSFELEAEKEKEDELNIKSNNEDYSTDSDKNIIYISKMRRNIMRKNTLNSGQENEYNNEYRYEFDQRRLIDKISKETNPNMKHIYLNLLEEINYYPNKYTNEGLISILKSESKKYDFLVDIYKENFLYLRDTIEELLQLIVDKIIIMPYPLRCICKIINILISKKFPGLTKYEVNSFIGQFILDKCIFPILALENKIFIESRVFSKKTRTCLDIIMSILSKANNLSLYDSYSDPEKTIFNPFILEIIPILNKFYDKLIDIQLPKSIDDLIKNTMIKFDNFATKKIFNFRCKKIKKDTKINPSIEETKNIDNNQPQSSMNQYFKDNPDEILHLQSICFSLQDIIFLIELIERNIDIFKELPRFTFFSKTIKKIKNQNNILNELIDEDNFSVKKTFYIAFKDEKNIILEKLIKNKKKDSTFESVEQDSELIRRRIKFCIKTILKGLNLLNNKDFAYLNFAQNTNKFFSALKYTLEEMGEYNELSDVIPLKWYSQYIYNYKNELDKEYQKEDFTKLYSEISTEEMNILNDLKKLSNMVITRDGMNLRCAEKILEKTKYELKKIEEAKKFNQMEKFIKTKKIEVCIFQPEDINIKSKNSEKDLLINILELQDCPYKNTYNENHIHLNTINNFIKLFSITNKIKLKAYVRESIIKGDDKYKISDIINKYMEIVVKKIKQNKNLFGVLTEDEIELFSRNIENHILRRIYKYIYPSSKSEKDFKILNETRSLGWLQPEHLEIRKLYVNQLKFAEKYINKVDEAKSIFDKLDCIQNAYIILNNTIKFISGKNENAGQDELTPLFQYILIKSQPERLSTNINYIKCFLSESELMGKNGFFVTQMESASTFILNMKSSYLKISNEEFNKNRELYRKIYEEKNISRKNTNKTN